MGALVFTLHGEAYQFSTEDIEFLDEIKVSEKVHTFSGEIDLDELLPDASSQIQFPIKYNSRRDRGYLGLLPFVRILPIAEIGDGLQLELWLGTDNTKPKLSGSQLNVGSILCYIQGVHSLVLKDKRVEREEHPSLRYLLTGEQVKEPKSEQVETLATSEVWEELQERLDEENLFNHEDSLNETFRTNLEGYNLFARVDEYGNVCRLTNNNLKNGKDDVAKTKYGSYINLNSYNRILSDIHFVTFYSEELNETGFRNASCLIRQHSSKIVAPLYTSSEVFAEGTKLGKSLIYIVSCKSIIKDAKTWYAKLTKLQGNGVIFVQDEFNSITELLCNHDESCSIWGTFQDRLGSDTVHMKKLAGAIYFIQSADNPMPIYDSVEHFTSIHSKWSLILNEADLKAQASRLYDIFDGEDTTFL